MKENIVEAEKIVSFNDATIVGVLMIITIAFGWTIIYLFKQNQKIHEKFIDELRKVNKFQNDFVNNLVKLNKS